MTKKQQYLLDCLKQGRLESKKQQDHLFKILNGDNRELAETLKDYLCGAPIELSKEHQQQGLNWLMNLWQTPTGRERKNNPFGAREMDILTNFASASLVGYWDAGNAYYTYYTPIYYVVGTDGFGFEYIVEQGGIKIIS